MSTSTLGPAQRDIWIDLTVPAPVFGMDLVAKVLGIDLADIAGPLLRAPVYDDLGQRNYPLVLLASDTAGAILPMRTFGAFAIKNYKGRIALFIPPALKEKWESSVSTDVRGEKSYTGRVGMSPAVAYLLTLERGKAAILDLPLVGALGIRLAPDSPGGW